MTLIPFFGSLPIETPPADDAQEIATASVPRHASELPVPAMIGCRCPRALSPKDDARPVVVRRYGVVKCENHGLLAVRAGEEHGGRLADVLQAQGRADRQIVNLRARVRAILGCASSHATHAHGHVPAHGVGRQHSVSMR